MYLSVYLKLYLKMDFIVNGTTCDDGSRTEVTTYTVTDLGMIDPEHTEFYHPDNRFRCYLPELKGVYTAHL